MDLDDRELTEVYLTLPPKSGIKSKHQLHPSAQSFVGQAFCQIKGEAPPILGGLYLLFALHCYLWLQASVSCSLLSRLEGSLHLQTLESLVCVT